jgi:23S rRNA (uridine2552-2'-O)-methyltransferase
LAKPRVLHDVYFKKAKAEGFVARSAYKLIEINQKKRIIRRGDCVLDLGCSPGSWLQVVEKLIGREGRAVGIDLQETKAVLGPTIRTFVGDAFKIDPAELLDAAGLGELRAPEADSDADDAAAGAGAGAGAWQIGPVPEGHVWLFDAVISDMAPNTTGHGDAFLSARLCDSVLDLCPEVLREGGNLCMKVLEGEPFPELLKRTRTMFKSAGTIKPAASRDISREIFIWALGFRGPR